MIDELLDELNLKNNDIKFFATIVLLGLSLLTALVLETQLNVGFIGELVLILIGVILAAGVLCGLWIEAEWAYPVATVIFAASMANLLWLFITTQAFLTFSFGLLVNVAGIVLCLIGIQKDIDWQALETYDTAKPRKKKRRR